MNRASLEISIEHSHLFFSFVKLCVKSILQGWRTQTPTLLNREMLGFQNTGKIFTVTPERVQRYLEVFEEKNPRYFFSQNGSETPPLFSHVFYIHTLVPIFLDQRLNLNFGRMFHAGSSSRIFRIIKTGEKVFPRSSIKDIIDLGKGELLVTQNECLTEQNESVYQSVDSWYVKKPKELMTESKRSFQDQFIWNPPENKKIQTIHEVTIKKSKMQEYARAAGDYNLIHISDLFARAAGLKHNILQGACTVGFVTKAIIDHVLDGDPNRFKRISVRLLKPVMADDSLKISLWKIDHAENGWAQEWSSEFSGSSILGIKVTNQKNEEVLSRTAALII